MTGVNEGEEDDADKMFDADTKKTSAVAVVVS